MKSKLGILASDSSNLLSPPVVVWVCFTLVATYQGIGVGEKFINCMALQDWPRKNRYKSTL
jgi:hypothetical protein